MDAIRAFNVAIDLRALPDMATKEEKLRAASKYYECDYDGKRHHYRHEFKYAPKWYVKRDSIIDDRDYKFTPKPRAIKWCIYYGHFPSKCICPWNGQCYNVSGGGSLCGTYEKRCGWDDDMYDTWCFMNGNLWDYVGENYVGMS
jgi:hypothetical protein